MTVFRGTAVLILTVLMFGACSGRAAESYPTLEALSTALQEEDIRCSLTDSGVGEAELVKEQGTCEIEDDQLEIFLFEDAGQRDGWLEFGGRLRPATATGPNWAIIGEQEPVEKAAEALGAELRE